MIPGRLFGTEGLWELRVSSEFPLVGLGLGLEAAAAMATDSILTTVRQYLKFDPAISISLEPIKRGASGRTIVRVKVEDREPFIGIHWTDERPDNDFYPSVSHFLKKAGFMVPEIIHESLRWRVVLVEDLGDVDLLSLKGQAWEKREPYYRSALEQLDKLFYTRVAKDMEFNPGFDTEMYAWEQEYFIDHLVVGLLGMDGSELARAEPMKELARRLGASARHLVHRDFQSQNFLLKDGKSYWIDFQGMRRGRQEYDLASLVFDPYMDHSAEDRERLLDLWEDISEERPLPQIFHECATQRLMQALGAYGKIIGGGKGEWYQPHVAVAARMLGVVTAGTDLEPLLKPVIEKAEGWKAE